MHTLSMNDVHREEGHRLQSARIIGMLLTNGQRESPCFGARTGGPRDISRERLQAEIADLGY
jgi:hypothetical protein